MLTYDIVAYSNYKLRVLTEIEQINAIRDQTDMEYDSILENHQAELSRILKGSKTEQ
jgi:hypothetical protein